MKRNKVMTKLSEIMDTKAIIQEYKGEKEKVCMICYQTDGNNDYMLLYDAIKSLGSHIHALENLWMVATNKNVAEISSLLIKQLPTKRDLIFVSEVDVTTAKGWMTNNVWDWIKEHKAMEE